MPADPEQEEAPDNGDPRASTAGDLPIDWGAPRRVYLDGREIGRAEHYLDLFDLVRRNGHDPIALLLAGRIERAGDWRITTEPAHATPARLSRR